MYAVINHMPYFLIGGRYRAIIPSLNDHIMKYGVTKSIRIIRWYIIIFYRPAAPANQLIERLEWDKEVQMQYITFVNYGYTPKVIASVVITHLLNDQKDRLP